VSLPQHLTQSEAGTVYVDLLTTAGTANVSIVTGDGSTLASGLSASISSVNTTLSAAVTRGDTSINVASASGIANAGTLFIQDDPEEILVRKVAAPVVSLRRPVKYDHVSAAVVQGTRITATVNAAVAGTLFWDGRCEWIVDGKKYFTAVECTKYPLDRLATIQDILDIEPSFYHLADEELDVDRLLDLALSDVLKRIAAKSPDLRTRVYPASTEFRHATALAALRMFYMRQRGDDASVLFERYSDVLKGELDRLCGVLPRDADQDGVIEPGEKTNMRSVRVGR